MGNNYITYVFSFSCWSICNCYFLCVPAATTVNVAGTTNLSLSLDIVPVASAPPSFDSERNHTMMLKHRNKCVQICTFLNSTTITGSVGASSTVTSSIPKPQASTALGRICLVKSQKDTLTVYAPRSFECWVNSVFVQTYILAKLTTCSYERFEINQHLEKHIHQNY